MTSGSRPEMRDLFYEGNMKGWGPALTAKRKDVSMATVDKFLTKMYRNNPDFVISVSRDFVKSCQTPVLILPDDIPAHPYAVAMEAATVPFILCLIVASASTKQSTVEPEPIAIMESTVCLSFP